MLKRSSPTSLGAALLLMAATVAAGAARAPAPRPPSETVEARHPGLASGVLTFARLAALPKGVLVRCGAVTLTAADLRRIQANTYDATADELRKNAFFLAERELAPKLLLLLARKAHGKDAAKSDEQLEEGFLAGVTARVRVTDQDIARFYGANEALFGGATLEAMKEPIRQHLLKEKKQAAEDAYLRTLGQRMKIEVSAAWADAQAPLALDNPVDRARRARLPALVVFGAPCG